MPNWCSNQITISGAPAQIRRLLDAATYEGNEGIFSLKAVYPVPEGLANVSAGSDEDFHAVVHGDWKKLLSRRTFLTKEHGEIKSREALIEIYEKGRAKGQDLRAIADQYEKNLQEHGCMTWYNWCVRHWGTKWDINGEYDYVEGSDCVSFVTDSAWSPPVEAFEHISEQYPELEFTLEYFEEGCSFIGKVTLQNGEATSSDEGEDCYDHDRFDFAPESYDDDEDWDEEDED
jgi:hypothetical protein